MKHLRSTLAILALAGAIAVAPQLAGAAVFTIDDTSPDDTITIDAGGFVSLDINGSLFESGVENSATMTLPESAGEITFAGTWPFFAPPASSLRVVFVEPEDPSVVSDVLSVDYDVAIGGELASIVGSFVSDFENNLGLVSDPQYTGYTVYVENSTGFDFSHSNLSARAVSDS